MPQPKKIAPSVGNWWLTRTTHEQPKKEKVLCPVCGTYLSKEGYRKHAGSAACEKASKIGVLKKAGYIKFRRIWGYKREKLEKAGIELLKAGRNLWMERWLNMVLVTLSDERFVEEKTGIEILQAINANAALKTLVPRFSYRVSVAYTHERIVNRGFLYLCHPNKEKMLPHLFNSAYNNRAHKFVHTLTQLLKNPEVVFNNDETAELKKMLDFILQHTEIEVTKRMAKESIEKLRGAI